MFAIFEVPSLKAFPKNMGAPSMKMKGSFIMTIP